MKTPTESILTLEAVATHFEQWRSRKAKGEPIPEPLWREAIELLDRYRISQVTRKLRLSGSDLNRRRRQFGAASPPSKQAQETTFVEIDAMLSDPASGPATTKGWLELSRPDGMRLHIHPREGRELLALVDHFMGNGGRGQKEGIGRFFL